MKTSAQLRIEAAAIIERAEAFERRSSTRFDSAPGSFVTGSSGRRRSGLAKKTDRAIEGSLDDLAVAKRLRVLASRLLTRADNRDPVVLQARAEKRQRDQQVMRSADLIERQERKSLPIVNDPTAPVHMTSKEWSATHRDFKGIVDADGYRYRSIMRDSKLQGVYLTDKRELIL